MPIEILPYQTRWPEEFAAIRDDLEEVLGELAIQIDHIGSTSIPGLGAKDVIDVQVTVSDLSSSAGSAHGCLVGAGFTALEHITSDHVPRGADPDPRAWQKRMFNERPGERRANIHIRRVGNPNQQYPLLFRDYLLAHPKSASSVELIKTQLARYHGEDAQAYYDIKDPVYDLIWEAALNWKATARAPAGGPHC